MTTMKIRGPGVPRCDYRCEHDPVLDRPTGARCQNLATHMIAWDDGRYSLGCGDHLTIDADASVKPRAIVAL